MAQILFLHTRGDRPAADFILRAFAQTNVKPLVVECSEETIIFEPGKQFEQTVSNTGAIFILFASAMANKNFREIKSKAFAISLGRKTFGYLS